MKASIIKIGNSKGVRIPKYLIDELRLHDKVNLSVKDGSLVITPLYEELSGRELAILSEGALADWNTPEEDEAWKDL